MTTPGPLAEEAAKLVEALSEWARGAVGETPLAAGATECTLCPFCQLLALMRRAQPETFQHLVDASSSLVAALRTVVETHEHGKPGHGGVERINLDDETPDPDRR